MAQIDEVKAQIMKTVTEVKRTNPMAGSVTNSVTINLVANTQIAVGGSAAMVYLPDEAEALAKAGEATYINLGTMLPVYEETLTVAVKTLREADRPWVLDPVGIGMGRLRTDMLEMFKDYKPEIIKGNASEIIALAGLWGLDEGSQQAGTRGVDTTESVDEAVGSAVSLARCTGGAVIVSGETDLITDGKQVATSRGGSKFLGHITGGGCALGGAAAVYLTRSSPFIAALTAVQVFNVAGRLAEEQTDAPASFQVAFLDELYKAWPEAVAHNHFEMEEYRA
ncbi:Hydroxyethylthiazole kinase [Alkalibacterium sp. AK22]|uniref:hydroxyethylthiazole kinase n=1 Tax=Alkalibacterium sp. AK22 TaxID=1229520 RepID=UPI0004490FD2|nr:hydroxyethylthiazole kinase [Alkalibacterium sp. AK22]EXJ22548.1 Hydroxyethylthiazole kinase [Alkalibacterium sp. AK22]